MIIRCKAYPRAGLVGNPSDGYFGRTMSFTFSDFFAEVVLYPSKELELLPGPRDRTVFRNLDGLASSIGKYGYYGGIRLVQASLKRFADYTRDAGISIEKKNFSMRYFSNIPPHVGMAGSSAIITACFRVLMKFYGVEIPKPQLANLVLSVETEELGISAGLQDRVAQAYQGLVYMDFDRAVMEEKGQGIYEPLSPEKLPPVYIAYRTDMSESSDVFHNDIRGRYDRGEAEVVEAMNFWAELTLRARDALLAGNRKELGEILDANFDRRRALYKIHPDNLAMIDAARAAGASAKFTGSGGAIVGLFEDDATYQRLHDKLTSMGIHVLRPNLI
ncbi:MAG: GHMP kinase [Kiritimatiellales bacterium]|nr:GHMP kinase [Kiritimatiellales bacterium]